MRIPRTNTRWFFKDHNVYVLRVFTGPQGELVVETAPCVPGAPGGRLTPLRRFWTTHEPLMTPLGEQVLHVPSVPG